MKKVIMVAIIATMTIASQFVFADEKKADVVSRQVKPAEQKKEVLKEYFFDKISFEFVLGTSVQLYLAEDMIELFSKPKKGHFHDIATDKQVGQSEVIVRLLPYSKPYGKGTFTVTVYSRDLLMVTEECKKSNIVFPVVFRSSDKDVAFIIKGHYDGRPWPEESIK